MCHGLIYKHFIPVLYFIPPRRNPRPTPPAMANGGGRGNGRGGEGYRRHRITYHGYTIVPFTRIPWASYQSSDLSTKVTTYFVFG